MLPTSTVHVRRLDPTTDGLPPELLSGFVTLLDDLDPDWIWVLEHDNEIKAACIGAPMHGVLFLLRIAATEDAPPLWPRTLLPFVLEDSKARGLKGYMVLLDAEQKAGRRLASLVARTGGVLMPLAMIVGIGQLEV